MKFLKAAIAAALFLYGQSMNAATYVYVSNAEDGDIGMYTLQPDGSLAAGPALQGRESRSCR